VNFRVRSALFDHLVEEADGELSDFSNSTQTKAPGEDDNYDGGSPGESKDSKCYFVFLDRDFVHSLRQ
jgi:hypothetical protein